MFGLALEIRGEIRRRRTSIRTIVQGLLDMLLDFREAPEFKNLRPAITSFDSKVCSKALQG